MIITNYSPDNKITYQDSEYKDSKCCGKIGGKSCNKLGKHKLRVSYIDKIGLFCENCAEDLLNSDMVSRVE